MKINPLVDLEIRKFVGSGITDYSSGLTNCAFNNNNGKWEITQRASIDISEDASALGTPPEERGRGIYYWETQSNLFIVNDDTVYEATQDGGEVGAANQISQGTERVTMLETIGTRRLVILDAENNEGWWIDSAASSVTAITWSALWPSTICHGGAILDGYLFVMDEDGVIYNSLVDDPTSTTATSFLEAERENDKGVYLGKHNEHIVAFGTRTIEFFYDAGYATGSPLQRRQDIMHNLGCADGLGVWENGDTIYFVGSSTTGQLAIYRLENFNPVMISNDTLNSYLTQGLTQDNLRIILSGWSAMGQDTLIMTVYTLTGASPGTIVPKLSICYNSVTKIWGFINTTVGGHNYFPLIAFTKRTGGQNATDAARRGEGIFYNGDIINVNDKLIPVDTSLGADGVYVDGVYEDDIYVSTSLSSGTNIHTIMRTGHVNGGVREYKFQSSEYLMMDTTDTSQTMTVKHADEGTTTFTTVGTIDTSLDKKEIYQGGRFMQRNYQLEYSGDEQFFFEYLGADLDVGR